MLAILAGILLGFLVGARHAFEPDHLAAVSTLVARARGPRAAARLGACWGLGHTIALVAVSGALIVSGGRLSLAWQHRLEGAVGVMLVALGVRAIARAVVDGRRGEPARHRHGARIHEHATRDPHVHLGRHALAWPPLAIGLVHGVAGSGALTAVVAASLPSVAARLAYLGLFGVGSVGGMAVVSALAAGAAGPLRRSARRRAGLALASGLASLAVGLVVLATAAST